MKSVHKATSWVCTVSSQIIAYLHLIAMLDSWKMSPRLSEIGYHYASYLHEVSKGIRPRNDSPKRLAES